MVVLFCPNRQRRTELPSPIPASFKWVGKGTGNHSALIAVSLALFLSACVGSGPVASLAETDTVPIVEGDLALADTSGSAPATVLETTDQASGQLAPGPGVPSPAPRVNVAGTQPSPPEIASAGQNGAGSQSQLAALAPTPPNGVAQPLASAQTGNVPANTVIENNLATNTGNTGAAAGNASPAQPVDPAAANTGAQQGAIAPDQNSPANTEATIEERFSPQQPAQNKRKRTIRRTGRGEEGVLGSRQTASLQSRSKPATRAAGADTRQGIGRNVVSQPRNAPAGSNALPGVKSNDELFGIKRKNEEESETSSRNTQVAALGSLGRLSPNGLRLQHDNVNVGCLKQGVLQIVKQLERRYGKKPIITSAYRSPAKNRRVGGARNSTHIRCMAVDLQVEGVSKWQLAKYLRSLPGRGGVGTYCRTQSVHVDIGEKRDWHHPCRRGKAKKRRKA